MNIQNWIEKGAMKNWNLFSQFPVSNYPFRNIFEHYYFPVLTCCPPTLTPLSSTTENQFTLKWKIPIIAKYKIHQIKTSSSGGISSSSFIDFLISSNQFLVLLNILYYQNLYFTNYIHIFLIFHYNNTYKNICYIHLQILLYVL